MYYRRYLPHWQPEGAEFFVTWRLAGTRPITADTFDAYDATLDRATGPRWLSDPRVASAVRDAILYGASIRQAYELHAWVIMPNHAHILLTPKGDLRRLMQWLKRATAWRANQIVGRTGSFWQAESYDHWIRTDRELSSTVAYIEANPVTAGLAACDDEWPWSSAFKSAESKTFCATGLGPRQ